MAELLQNIVAASLWGLIFLLLLAIVNNKKNRSIFHGSTVLSIYPLFCFFQIVVVKLLNLTHLLNATSITIVYLISIGTGGVIFFSRFYGRAVHSLERERFDSDAVFIRRIALLCIGATVAGLAVFSLFTPTHVWDVQAYHLPMVASYVQHESLSPWPTQELRQVFRVNGAELQMLNLAFLSRSDAWMELPNLLALIVSLVAVFEIARLVLHSKILGYLSVILLLTAPQVLLGSVTAKNDLIFLALILCTFYWLIRVAVHPDSKSRAHLIILGLSTSLAAATKVLGLNVLGTAGLVLLLLVIRKRLPFRALVFYGVSSLGFLLILASDVYWNNLMRSQMPIGIVPGEVHFTIGTSNFVAAAKLYLYDLSFKRLLALQIFEHDFSHYGYFFPFLLVLGTTVAVQQLATKSNRNIGLATVSLFTFILFLSVILARVPIYWDQRFMIWMIPAFSILAVSLLRKAHVRTLLALISFSSAFSIINITQTYTNAAEGIFAKSALHLVKHGELPRLVDVLSRKYWYKIDGFDVLEEDAEEQDAILYVGAEDTWMYPAWGKRFTRYVSGVADVSDVRKKIASGKYRFVVIEQEAADDLKEAATSSTQRIGYHKIVNVRGRSIYKRTKPIPPKLTEIG